MKHPITDIHMHVVPAVDDGARSPEESCEMLRLAATEGIEAVFATPHDAAFLNNDVRAAFRRLKEAACAQAIPVELHLGCELRITAQTAERCVRGLNDGTYPTMGASRCVLSEFTFGTPLEECLYCIGLLTAQGYTPIIAHIERYDHIDLAFAKALRAAGALVQLNACSIADEADDGILSRANLFLRERLVDFLGTDAHRTDRRPPLYRNGLTAMERLYTEEYAALAAAGNPYRFLLSPAGV